MRHAGIVDQVEPGKARTREKSHPFTEVVVQSHAHVISVLALQTDGVDHSQGESGITHDPLTGAKSLRLKILPLSR